MFSPVCLEKRLATSFNHQGVAAGDINGDGCTDIVNANYNYGLVIYLGSGCSPVADIAPSLGLAATTLALRVDNFGAGAAASPEAAIDISTVMGTLTTGMLPAGCTLESSSTNAAKIVCTVGPLAAGTSRTVLVPISISGNTPRNQVRAAAHVTTTSVELKLLNNSTSVVRHAL